MLENLTKRYNLVGMSQTEIENLLGKADKTSENEMEYVIAAGWVDPEMLVLTFEGEIVTDFYTYTEFKPPM